MVGASGSGKSTIVSLIECFYDPTLGVVKFDGVNAKDLNLKWLRSQIGLVFQEPTLFSTTIRGNIAHGLIGTIHENASKEVKEALIKAASIKANADAFITKLPLGYDTQVGERGFLLSGGQKQRVAIARAIVSDPRVLLLDEAISTLDTQGRTTITIAHRLSTIKDANVIHVMGDGLVIESGTYDDLIQANGVLALCRPRSSMKDKREVARRVPTIILKILNLQKKFSLAVRVHVVRWTVKFRNRDDKLQKVRVKQEIIGCSISPNGCPFLFVISGETIS